MQDLVEDSPGTVHRRKSAKATVSRDIRQTHREKSNRVKVPTGDEQRIKKQRQGKSHTQE